MITLGMVFIGIMAWANWQRWRGRSGFGLLMTGAAALFPVVLFSTTEPSRRLIAADCAAPEASLVIGTVWWFPALILAFGYLYIIQRHYSGKVNVSKDNQGLY